jgi:hypothetical protein
MLKGSMWIKITILLNLSLFLPLMSQTYPPIQHQFDWNGTPNIQCSLNQPKIEID